MKSSADDFPLWDVLEKFDRENEFNAELKEYRERHGKATAADKAQAAASCRPRRPTRLRARRQHQLAAADRSQSSAEPTEDRSRPKSQRSAPAPATPAEKTLAGKI